MALNGVISHLLSLGTKLLPAVVASSSSSPIDDENKKIESELAQIMRMLKRIKATLYDAEQREIKDESVKLWLHELQGVAYDAEDVLDEYHYEVLRAQVEARDVSAPDSRKRKLIQVPDGMFDQIQQLRNKFAEIEKDRIALRLLEEDGPRHTNSELQIPPTGHDIDTSIIFGREREKEKLIDLLSSKSHEHEVVSVVTIVGTGGLGKTTLAQLVYNDQKVQQRFDKSGWICVSDDFTIERLMRELVQSITGRTCCLTNISALQGEIKEMIKGKRILLILDDVWNEKRSLWELFHASFKSASFVKILVTTRSKHVARIMQTEPTFHLDYMSEEQCWRLFKHYAFGGVNQYIGSNMIELGKQIFNKSGMLPLSVKSIASLLKHEMEEKSWREILESELWESDACSEIFPPLQLSYARLPTYLKPCLLYCSMFPKDFRCDTKELVQLWISQGYVESKGMKNAKDIGWEYAMQLWQRSFFECSIDWNNSKGWCKLHDMIHDLARLNSKNTCFSIEGGLVNKLQDFSNEIYHLCITHSEDLVEPMPFRKFATLHTLIIMGYSAENLLSNFDLSMLQKLRALLIKPDFNKLEDFSSVGNLKHLRFLLLEYFSFERLPECICSLYNLNSLEIRHCNFHELPTKIGNLLSLERLVISGCLDLWMLPESLCQLNALRIIVLVQCSALLELPENMGNLVSLETVVIKSCLSLKWLPESLGQLQALRKLEISYCYEVSQLPPSLGKVVGIQTLRVELICETIGWLKDFVDLRGTLTLVGLENMSRLANIQSANLVSLQNVERLQLCWESVKLQIDNERFFLSIKSGQKIFLEDRNDYEVMASLQPHPNLRELYIMDYGGISFPEWIGNANSCASLERVNVRYCKNLKFLSFGSLHKLKYLNISFCDSLLSIKAEWLPMELEELQIFYCRELSYVSGLQRLKSLVKFCIEDCNNLHSLLMDAGRTVEGCQMITDESLHENLLLGLRKLTSIRILTIQRCPTLELLADELLCVKSCEVEVRGCPLLKKWCLQHGITYKDKAYYYEDSEDETDTENEI